MQSQLVSVFELCMVEFFLLHASYTLHEVLLHSFTYAACNMNIEHACEWTKATRVVPHKYKNQSTIIIENSRSWATEKKKTRHLLLLLRFFFFILFHTLMCVCVFFRLSVIVRFARFNSTCVWLFSGGEYLIKHTYREEREKERKKEIKIKCDQSAKKQESNTEWKEKKKKKKQQH